MASPYNIYIWYWRVQDSSPGTQVFSSASGSFVPLSNATYVAWLAADGGNTPSSIPTLAELYADVFNSFNEKAARLFYQSFTPGADLTLTNPLASFIAITPTVDNIKVIFPQANKPGSLAKGQTVRIRNTAAAGTRPFTLYANDGTTTIFTALGGVWPIVGGEDILFTATANDTPNGIVVNNIPVSRNDPTGLIFGNVSIRKTTPTIFLLKQGSGDVAGIYGTNVVAGSSKARWKMELGDTAAESGSNVGSDFAFTRYDDAGASLGIPFKINRASGAVALQGSATNDSAAASFVGEYLERAVAQASAVTVSGAWTNLGSVVLTAGDWDVNFLGYFTNTSGSVTVTEAYISWGTTSNALDNTSGRFTSGLFGTVLPLNGIASLFCGARLSLSASATYYANVYAAITGGGTLKSFGVLSARRRR